MANPQVTKPDELREKLIRFAAYVRTYLRDFKELNRIIEGEETNPRMMMWAVLDAIDDFNETPPPIGTLPIDSIPPSILKLGVAVTVLESVGHLQTRNRLSFSDGGVQAQISDKSPELMNWIQLLGNRYEQKKLSWKTSKNISQAFGFGVSSEYAGLNFWYGDFGLSAGQV